MCDSSPHTFHLRGVVAQLVEHHNGIVGVISSILFGSTKLYPESKRIRGFLFKGRSKVLIGVGRRGDGVIILLAPNLTADFRINISTVA